MRKLITLILSLLLLTSCNTQNKNFIDEVGRHNDVEDLISYTYYLPSTYNKNTGLLVYLHGCGQKIDNIYNQFNIEELAEQYNCIIVLPSQNEVCNSSGCWNWFFQLSRKGQTIDAYAINSITKKLIEKYNINEKKVYISGLSAGAAQAIGLFYSNDLYKGLASVAGIADGLANNVDEAYAAMEDASNKTYKADFYLDVSNDKQKAIVFQGDADTRVNPNNGEVIVEQLVTLFDHIDDKKINDSLKKKIETGEISTYSCEITTYGKGKIVYYDINNMPHENNKEIFETTLNFFFGK